MRKTSGNKNSLCSFETHVTPELSVGRPVIGGISRCLSGDMADVMEQGTKSFLLGAHCSIAVMSYGNMYSLSCTDLTYSGTISIWNAVALVNFENLAMAIR